MKKHILICFQFIFIEHIHTYTYTITHRRWLVYQTQNTVHAHLHKWCWRVCPAFNSAWLRQRYWFEKRQRIVFALCNTLLCLNWCTFYELSSMTCCRQVICCKWSSLLSGQDCVQVDLDVVNDVAQVGANVGAHVPFVHTQGWCTGLVHQGTCLLTNATAKKKERKTDYLKKSP